VLFRRRLATRSGSRLPRDSTSGAAARTRYCRCSGLADGKEARTSPWHPSNRETRGPQTALAVHLARGGDWRFASSRTAVTCSPRLGAEIGDRQLSPSSFPICPEPPCFAGWMAVSIFPPPLCTPKQDACPRCVPVRSPFPKCLTDFLRYLVACPPVPAAANHEPLATQSFNQRGCGLRLPSFYATE
jgi:hypothetical protein